jgi:hypothetical protein
LPAGELLARPVRIRGIELGRAVDVVLDVETMRAIGLDVRCGDGVMRFLPLAATRVRPSEIEVRSALLLLDETDTTFYRNNTRLLSQLRGAVVRRGSSPLGVLADLVFGESGPVTALVLDDGRLLEWDPLSDIGPSGRASAA